MIEAQLRAKGPALQRAYDRMPYSVQNFLTSARGWFLTRNRYAPGMYSYLRELRRHEKWSTEEIARFQLNSIQRIADYARQTVPFYSNYARVAFKSPDDLRKYPVLTREVVSQNSDRLISSTLPAHECIRVGTRVTLFGSRVVPPEREQPPFWTNNYLERQMLMSIFHLSETNAPHYIAFLRRNKGKVLEGFPSVLGILADFVLRTGTTIPMQAVFTDGEPLYPFLRENIEKAFGATAFDLYGNTEYAGLLTQCEKGQMHAVPDYAYLEILNENDQPVQHDEEGYLVWTGFINDAMPLIRYRIGDRGCWQPKQSCSCGRPFPVVRPTITRDSDTLRCPDGRLFSPRALNQSLKGATALRFCQLVHERPGHLLIRGVASQPSAYDDLMGIQKNLQKILGPSFTVTSTLVDAPIVRAGGKIPLIIQPAATAV